LDVGIADSQNSCLKPLIYSYYSIEINKTILETS
jgi:hypothetical protein